MRKALTWIAAALAAALAALFVFGPYEPVVTDVAVEAPPEDLDAWLAAREADVADLRADEAARILWAGAPGARTETAIVYVHGYSAGVQEIRPVPDRMAEMLGANLYLPRLSGHGRGGDAMAEPAVEDWARDMAEAMAVGRRLGERVIVVGTSTGGTLAAVLAADPAMAPHREGLAGVAFIAPNFRVAAPAARLLSLPAARHWAGLVAGEARSFDPVNAAHGRHWTTAYPTVALLPMQALVDHAAGLDYAAVDLPALFRFDPEDAVVDHGATEAVAADWGGPVAVQRVETAEGDDPYNHVIAGDILSPGATGPTVGALVAWAQGL